MRTEEWARAAFWCLTVLALSAWVGSVRGPGWGARLAGVAALLLGLAVSGVGLMMAYAIGTGRVFVYDNPRRDLELRASVSLIALVTLGAGGWSLHSAWRLLVKPPDSAPPG